MTPINVLFVSLTEMAHGAERVMLELIERMDRSRYRPFVVVPADGGVSDRCRALGVQAFVVDAAWWLPMASERRHGTYPWRRYWEESPHYVDPIVEIIERHDISVVYSCSACILHGALAALGTGRPHIHHIQEGLGDAHYDRLMPFGDARMAYRVIGALSTRLVCISEASRREIAATVDDAKVRLVRLGFDPVTPRGQTFSFPPDGARIRVGIVAGVWPRKGCDLIAPIVQRVCAERRDVHFYWLGIGPPDLVARLSAAGEVDGAPRLHFLGHSNNVASFMHSIDFLLHPARSECFPRVIVEAALAGRPAISTRCGGGAEMIDHGVSGLLADVGDVDALAAHVLALAGEPSRTRTMGQAAARRAATLTMNAYVRGMEAVLADAYAAGPVASSRLLRRALGALLRLPSFILPSARRVQRRLLSRGSRRTANGALHGAAPSGIGVGDKR